MALDLDNYLGIHAKALVLREQRASQLAMNMANVNTPNYKAKDIDFKQTLAQEMSGNSSQTMIASDPNHITTANSFQSKLQYRNPSHMTLDGNTVDKNLEATEFARNAVSYQASLTFLDGKIKSMLTALKGE
ncbi:flagellar basal body rod protein FlgB [Legionella jordanis]|uniref:Flagellar basal body rod protein FlgB n=1 Tax=Legionella jordanis TaxID=456 RepID=A0A0W0V832_9GAMM|nr:flagellar basal body rod protein FlgB [Legionella jordanis]KTD16275.1 flagellar basal-body rod protein FlgB [Legionella jordanis]RMX04511.1 flagellar basal body rod protein FlgB [Legionella jordanis]VEH12268.1 flagellar basal-body rod protein FlgB [Legionella jordanis]HAT8713478.1 flagellar basal body rod protein FlgB [Legionella jordanis]